MIIKINTNQSGAVKIGRNFTSWEVEINVEALTDAQRDILSERLSMYESARLDLCDTTGEITAASIQAYIDAQAMIKMKNDRYITEENAKTLSRHAQMVEDYELGKIDECHISTGSYHTLVPEEFYALLERQKNESLRRIDAWETAIAPEVSAYFAGGLREFPSWVGAWSGKRETLEKILAEDKCRADKEKIDSELRKIAQLTEVVYRLGTNVQIRKWVAGCMARSEVIDLLWHDVFPGDALPIDKCHLCDGTCAACLEDGNSCHQSIKLTLTNDQFLKATEIIDDIVPSITVCYYHQYDNDDNAIDAVFVRVTKTLGEYTLEADYIL